MLGGFFLSSFGDLIYLFIYFFGLRFVRRKFINVNITAVGMGLEP